MSRCRRGMAKLSVMALLVTGTLFSGTATNATAQAAYAQAVAPQATVTLSNVAILAGQSFLGAIVPKSSSNPVTSATVSGGCVTAGNVSDTDPSSPGIQFRLPTLPRSATGSCTLTFMVAFGDNTTETDTADIVIAPNTASTGTVVTQTVTGLGTAPVDIQLFNCADVSNRNGVLTFTGTQSGGVGNFAVPGTNAAVVTALNGAPTNTTSNQANGVTPTNGSLTVSFTDNAAGECVTPVVFQRGTGANADRLPLGTNNQALVAAATGAPTAFLPAPGPGGTVGSGLIPTALVTAVQPPYYIITTAGTFIQRDTDVIDLYNSATGNCNLAPRIPGSGHRRLTPGDLIGGFYDPKGISTFCLSDIAPTPPVAVTAIQNSAAGGTTVIFTIASSTETADGITSYNIYRSPATAPASPGGADTCPTSTPVALGTSPQTQPPAPYTSVAAVAATGAGGYTYNDISAPPGPGASAPNAFCYAVASVAVNEDGGTQAGSARPANSSSPPPLSSGTATATAPAPEVPAPFSQTITFTSTAPATPVVGGSYQASATGGGSTSPVTFSADRSSTPGACTVSTTGTVAFTGVGSCVIDANQAGDANYTAAPQVSQTVTVTAVPAAITTTSGGGQTALVGQAFPNPLTVTVTDNENPTRPSPAVPVTFTVTSGSASFNGAASTTVPTVANGQASVTLTAGRTPGPVIVTATTPGVAGQATFAETVTSAPKPSADLKVTLRAPSKAGRGAFTAKITVTNLGFITARSVYTGLITSNGLAVTDAHGGATFSHGQTVIFYVPRLAAGQSITYTVTVTPHKNAHDTQHLEAATASIQTPDPNYSNNATATTVILP